MDPEVLSEIDARGSGSRATAGRGTGVEPARSGEREDATVVIGVDVYVEQ